jgi:Spy/CpxP family protein refolding chaperone
MAQRKELREKVEGVAEHAKKLIKILQSSAKKDKDAILSKKELDSIRRLIERSEDAMSDAKLKAKAMRHKEIDELTQLIKDIELALATPGLDEDVRNDLKNLRRRRRAKLIRLQIKLGMDFSGILTPKQIQEIQEVLKRAKADVAKKKKAAAFSATIMKIADVALGVLGKAVAVT